MKVTLPAEKIIYVQPEWVVTQKLPLVFVGIEKRTAEKYVSEMYTHPDYSDGVMKPSNRLTLVNVERFVEFLRFKDSDRFK